MDQGDKVIYTNLSDATDFCVTSLVEMGLLCRDLKRARSSLELTSCGCNNTRKQTRKIITFTADILVNGDGWGKGQKATVSRHVSYPNVLSPNVDRVQ